jgi:hypothetical protein
MLPSRFQVLVMSLNPVHPHGAHLSTCGLLLDAAYAVQVIAGLWLAFPLAITHGTLEVQLPGLSGRFPLLERVPLANPLVPARLPYTLMQRKGRSHHIISGTDLPSPDGRSHPSHARPQMNLGTPTACSTMCHPFPSRL